jgi:hypothetical protein
MSVIEDNLFKSRDFMFLELAEGECLDLIKFPLMCKL